jgi:Domain of unknown function (DUF1996)
MQPLRSAHSRFRGIFLVSPLLLGACVGSVSDSEQDSIPGPLAYQVEGDATWSDCAAQGGLCDVGPSARQVRFGGADGEFVVVLLSGTIRCDNGTFGTDFGAEGNACAVREAQTSGNASASAADHGGAHAVASSDPATTDGHSMDGMSHGGLAVTGALPVGDPGAEGAQVGATTETPGPSDGTGSFRTRCNFSHMNWDDPIVYPNQPGRAHLHAFFGNAEADAYSTAESLREHGTSTCRGGTLNRTAYWAPALLDASGRPVEPLEVDVYYKTGYRGVRPADVQPLPEGLRMIAGDMHATERQEHAYWGCKDNYIGEHATIQDCSASDLVMMVVVFPQCWDGHNLDADDHKSHLAYPQGGCPASHPVALPEITMKVYYPMPGGGTDGYRLASDMYDPALGGGRSVHADYFAAWDQDIMKAFVQNCDNRAVDCHSHLLGDGRMLF